MSAVKLISELADTKAKVADPCIMVIFGAAGDLTRRKLIPALYNLATAGLISDNFAMVGTARAKMTTEEFRAKLSEEIQVFAAETIQPDIWNKLLPRIHYIQGNFQDAASYKALGILLSQLDSQHGANGNHLFYLATPPEWFGEIIEQLGAAGLTQETSSIWRRVIIEKPFGTDLESARKLNDEITKVVNEDQIYRIDHYLGKETVQNLMVFRFANGLLEPIWNHHHIDNVQITVAESVGVEGRGHYYDLSGALRDVVENHMFQLLTLIAMEAPDKYDAEYVRNRKAELVEAITPFSADDVFKNAVRAQYTSGIVNGKGVAAYCEEPSVSPDSLTETFVALKIEIDNDRWRGVPFYLRTGKSLHRRVSEIAVQFKRSPLTVFDQHATQHLDPSTLVLRIQPEEGICLRMGAKHPGPVLHMDMVNMNFDYADYFGKEAASGYETLLYDCMNGDATLYTRSDNLETCWKIVNDILATWRSALPHTLYKYPAGSWGPKEADDLLARDGHKWRTIDD